jgi:N-acetylglucosamine kinase-like BadF-type ATPase
VLVGRDGGLLAHARGPGSNPQNVGHDATMAVLDTLIGEAVAQAGLPRDGGPVAEHLAAYLAGADLPVEERELAARLSARGWSRTLEVANDTFALLRAGVDEPYGVAVVCGAGINCVGRNQDGDVVRFPALGRWSGDWGGGYSLGEEGLWWAVRAEDGRGQPTLLCERIASHFGCERASDVSAALHLREIPAARLGELAPLVVRTSTDGDPVAGAIVDRLATEIATLALTTLRRLRMLDLDVDVVLGGGVLRSNDARLLDGIATRLAEHAPRARPRLVAQPPIVGAAILGLEHVGAGPAAVDRLRAEFAAEA